MSKIEKLRLARLKSQTEIELAFKKYADSASEEDMLVAKKEYINAVNRGAAL
jgi:hypothetical protein